MLLPGSASPSPFNTLKVEQTESLLLIRSDTNRGASHATATIIDVPGRLAITSYHSIVNSHRLQALSIEFEQKDKKEIDSNPLKYQHLFMNKEAIPAEVVYSEPAHDLALIRLKQLPKEAKAIPLATAPLTPESKLYFDGNPFEKNLVWQRVEGTAGKVEPAKWVWPGGQALDTHTLISTAKSELGAGFSGGAVRNEAGELLALVIAGREKTIYSVDAATIRGFLERSKLLNTAKEPAQAKSSTVESDR